MIEVSHLRKKFGQLVAVDDISFKVEPGEILGFLGPNGAGKSTTMKVITGFIAPTTGKVSIWGHDIASESIEAQRRIGYLPEGAPCYEEMTPRSFLRFIAEVRGYKKQARDDRVRAVVDTMSLQPVLDQRIETLSKGFKRRVGLAQAILHDPDVLILDEPTDGLDPNQKHQVRKMIRGLSKNKIVIISTHILEEVTAVCTRALIIAKGKIVADCKPGELERKSRYHQAVTFRLEDSVDLSEVIATLSGDSAVKEIEQNGTQLTVIPRNKDGGLLLAIIALAQQAGWRAEDLFQERGRLDDVFRMITGEDSDVER